MDSIIFLVLGAVALTSALAVVLLRSPVYSVLSLIVCFFSIAGIYLLLNAPFLAIVNIIVYAGAIMVLFLFVIMLLNLNKHESGFKSAYFYVAVVGVVLALATLVLGAIRLAHVDLRVMPGHEGSLKAIADILFREYMLPFELSSVLFLTAIVGVVVISRKKQGSES